MGPTLFYRKPYFSTTSTRSLNHPKQQLLRRLIQEERQAGTNREDEAGGLLRKIVDPITTEDRIDGLPQGVLRLQKGKNWDIKAKPDIMDVLPLHALAILICRQQYFFLGAGTEFVLSADISFAWAGLVAGAGKVIRHTPTITWEHVSRRVCRQWF